MFILSLFFYNQVITKYEGQDNFNFTYYDKKEKSGIVQINKKYRKINDTAIAKIEFNRTIYYINSKSINQSPKLVKQ